MGISYLFNMKAVWVLVFCCVSFVAGAQVSFRRDFTLGKHRKSHGFSIDWVTVGFGRSRGLGTPNEGNRLIIDVNALRNLGREYSYQQLAERTYNLTPGIPTFHAPQPWVPYYLLVEPPVMSLHTEPTVKVRR